MLPLLNSGRIQLLDNRRLITQLHGLERRTARGGKDSIDHGPGRFDDLANSVAGALVLADGKAGLNFTREMVAAVSRPGPMTGRFGKSTRFDRGRRGAPMPLGGMTGNFSDRV
jgi:hypothetical protein